MLLRFKVSNRHKSSRWLYNAHHHNIATMLLCVRARVCQLVCVLCVCMCILCVCLQLLYVCVLMCVRVCV